MKYLVFVLMFLPISCAAGVLAGLVFQDIIVGVAVAVFFFAVSIDVCFFGHD